MSAHSARPRSPKPPPPPPPTPADIAAMTLCPYARQLCRHLRRCDWSQSYVIALLQRHLAPRQTDVPQTPEQRQKSAYRSVEQTLAGCPQAYPIAGPQEDEHA